MTGVDGRKSRVHLCQLRYVFAMTRIARSYNFSKLLFSSFPLKGHTVGFYPQHKKLALDIIISCSNLVLSGGVVV